MVESRWEMMSSVRVWASSPMQFQISCSLSRSTLEVASSKRMYSARHNSARAMPIFCRWPPESFPPASPTEVSRPAGWASTHSFNRTWPKASNSSSSVALGAAMRRFSRMVPLYRLTVWGTKMTRRRSSSGVRLTRSRPSNRMRPFSQSWKRMSKEAMVDFPLPERPTRAVTFPLGISKDTSRRAASRP